MSEKEKIWVFSVIFIMDLFGIVAQKKKLLRKAIIIIRKYNLAVGIAG